MKRMHIHVAVDELTQSVEFYSALLGEQPTKIKKDYAKWMLDDPRTNLAISTRSNGNGVDHLGIQVGDEADLERLRKKLAEAAMTTFDEGETQCCYAHSDKSWVQDPAGVVWEIFHTIEDVEQYRDVASNQPDACCTTETKGQPGCCKPLKDAGRCCA